MSARTKHWVEILIVVFGLAVLGFIFGVLAKPKAVAATASLEKSTGILPTEKVTVHISHPVTLALSEGGVTLDPPTSVRYEWSADRQRLVFTPKENWKEGASYTIRLASAGNKSSVTLNAALAFSVISYPKLESFVPADGARDVVVDIEDPLQARFDVVMDDFLVKLELDPAETVSYRRSDDQRRISFLASGQFKEGQHYAAKLSVKHRSESDDRYQKIHESSFDTKPPTPKPTSVKPDFEARLLEAKRSTPAQIQEGKYIDINVTTQVMTIFENGKALDAYLVSSGKRGMDTPQGTFAIRNKFPRAWSKTYGLFMPFWMAITPDGKYGIHELPEWPNGYKEGQNHLGTPVSHGCVRLGVGAAERVYDFVEIGTPVVVHK